MTAPAIEVVELRPEEEWRPLAACRGMDTGWWYPSNGYSSWEAKGVCAQCPVAADCLEYALANREQLGVWGGLTYRERLRYLHERGATYGRCERCQRAMVQQLGPHGSGRLLRYCGDDCRQAERAERKAAARALAARAREVEEALCNAI